MATKGSPCGDDCYLGIIPEYEAQLSSDRYDDVLICAKICCNHPDVREFSVSGIELVRHNQTQVIMSVGQNMLRHTMSVLEFDKLVAEAENGHRRLELIHGAVVEKMPTQLHGWIVGQFFRFIKLFLTTHPPGRHYIEAHYQISGDEHNARIIDLSYVAGMERPIIDRGPAPYTPDLAIEVQLPDDTTELTAHGSSGWHSQRSASLRCGRAPVTRGSRRTTN